MRQRLRRPAERGWGERVYNIAILPIQQNTLFTNAHATPVPRDAWTISLRSPGFSYLKAFTTNPHNPPRPSAPAHCLQYPNRCNPTKPGMHIRRPHPPNLRINPIDQAFRRPQPTNLNHSPPTTDQPASLAGPSARATLAVCRYSRVIGQAQTCATRRCGVLRQGTRCAHRMEWTIRQHVSREKSSCRKSRVVAGAFLPGKREGGEGGAAGRTYCNEELVDV